MAFVDAAIAVGSTFGLDGVGAALLGGGLMGAGAGALYGGITGGNIGKDALMGGVFGAGGAYGSGMMGWGSDAADTAFGVGATTPTVAGPAATAYTPSTGAAFTPEQLQAQAVAQDVSQGASLTPEQYQSQMMAQDLENGANAGTGTGVTSTGSSLGSGFQQALNWMGDNKGLTAGAALLGISALGGNKPTTYQTPGAGNTMNTGYFKLDPSKFQPTRMQPTNPLGGVKPTYPNYVTNPYNPTQGYASGGITSLSSGGDAMSKYRDYQDTAQMLNSYESMLTGQNNPYTGSSTPQQAVPSWVSNPTVPTDNQLIDANTKGMSPYDAAKYRLAQSYASAGAPTSAGIGLANRANPAYGQINTDPAMVQAAMAAQQQQVQGAAQGGIMGYSLGGELEAATPWNQAQTALDNPGQTLIGANTPFETNVWNEALGTKMNPTVDMQGAPYETNWQKHYASGGIAEYSLGGYASGGNPRLLQGPGDGMSDNIPATIGGRQPARLADGEFVVPADVVSHLGNGSTDAGAKKLHGMMDKVRMARTGKKKQAPQVKTDKFIP